MSVIWMVCHHARVGQPLNCLTYSPIHQEAFTSDSIGWKFQVVSWRKIVPWDSDLEPWRPWHFDLQNIIVVVLAVHNRWAWRSQNEMACVICDRKALAPSYSSSILSYYKVVLHWVQYFTVSFKSTLESLCLFFRVCPFWWDFLAKYSLSQLLIGIL